MLFSLARTLSARPKDLKPNLREAIALWGAEDPRYLELRSHSILAPIKTTDVAVALIKEIQVTSRNGADYWKPAILWFRRECYSFCVITMRTAPTSSLKCRDFERVEWDDEDLCPTCTHCDGRFCRDVMMFDLMCSATWCKPREEEYVCNGCRNVARCGYCGHPFCGACRRDHVPE